MKYIIKLLCRLGFHIWNPIELERGWRAVCMNCGHTKQLYRCIDFNIDILPILKKKGYLGRLQAQPTSFDYLLIVQNSTKYATLAIPSTPITDGDKFINSVIERIDELLYN